ncbi:MAG: radical SAM protein [Elusimicrobiota bacterium]|nr:radical SAM protein [Elusimicrobiota bacterium]
MTTKTKNPKIVFATIPLRAPSSHLPIASLAIMTALKRHGYDNVSLYEINILRPKYEEVLEYFRLQKPDIVGLSAVVSTSYAFVKQLAADLRKMYPDLLIVCGGNLVANVNVLMAKTEIDICCTGEGEVTMREIVDHWVAGTMSPQELGAIKGIAFRDENRKMVITPYAPQLEDTEIFDVDWDIADATPGVERCFSADLGQHGVFVSDIRYYDPKRRGKRFGRFYASKGCVARCTFCHRFTKGIRYMPVELIEKRLGELIRRYNIGFVYFTDENFGTHAAWLHPFCDMIKKFDVLWGVGGIRVNRINAESLKKMYDAGCTSVAYGTETGSEKMLAVMEKALTLADNYKVVKLTPAANLYYSPQMVVGMPGETEETIEETDAFLRAVYSEDPFVHPAELSVNYAQALPGTPLYESGRVCGHIEPTIDGEEAYLFRVSDKNARDIDSTVNHTEVPHLIWKSWAHQIRASANYAYIRKFGLKEFDLWNRVHYKPYGVSVRDSDGKTYFADSKVITGLSGSFEDIKAAIRQMDRDYRSGKIQGATELGPILLRHPIALYHLRRLIPLVIGVKEFRRRGFRAAMKNFAEYFAYQLRKFGRNAVTLWTPKPVEEGVSLRKQVKDASEKLDATPEMAPLRAGR